MDVGAIHQNGYSAAGARHRENMVGTGFAETIGRTAQENAADQIPAGGEKSVFRWLYAADGSTGEVYRAQGDTSEHPIYRVASRDAAGNLTEQIIDVSQVDPNNCSTYEMYAYAAHLKESGKGGFEETVLHAVSARAAAGAEQNALASWDYSKNIDWTKAAEELMQSAYACGDLKGYWEWKKFIGFLFP